MNNISLVTTDGSRVDTQFRWGDKNVTAQVRSLIFNKFIEVRDGRLATVNSEGGPQMAVDTTAAIKEIRNALLGDGPVPTPRNDNGDAQA